MTIIPAKIPSITKRIFPNYVWDFSSRDKTIYLTFDDGPTPEITTWTLEQLNKYNAKATFFCIGSNVEKHPEIFKTILKNGHSIGNHTHNHLKGWQTSKKDYLQNVKQAEDIIDFNQLNKIQENKQKLFRPPYGKIKPSQGKKLIELGYKIIMWSVITFDWEESITKEECLKNAIENTSEGNIIVFHDSVKASKNMMYALPKVLDYFSKKGFAFKAI